MGQLLDLQEARRRLGLALEVLCHDRWVVGYLRGGSLQPIAASEISRRLLQGRPLLPLSRRALFEQRPVVVNSVFPYTNPSSGFDWELDWPAVMYAPSARLSSARSASSSSAAGATTGTRTMTCSTPGPWALPWLRSSRRC